MKSLSIIFKISSLLILTAWIFTSCQKTELGKEITFHIGERQKITSKLSFTVDSARDSRCPVGFFCFYAGDVSMFFNIHNSQQHIDTLLTCFPGPNVIPFDIAGFKWKVLEVNPYPGTLGTNDQKDKLIKMIITED
jgi:hypothetical protein